MAIADVAAAAKAVFPASIQLVMVAIAGPESAGTFSSTIQGDKIGSTYTLANGQTGTIPNSPYNCGGYTSFGPWQVNLPANHALIQKLMRVSNPCQQADWITGSYVNSAQAALAVYRRQGFGAWTTYKEGTYTAWLPAAAKALGQPLSITTVSAMRTVVNGTAVPVATTSVGIGGTGLGVSDLAFFGIAALLLAKGIALL